MKVGRKNIPGRKSAWYKNPKWEKARQVGEWGGMDTEMLGPELGEPCRPFESSWILLLVQ